MRKCGIVNVLMSIRYYEKASLLYKEVIELLHCMESDAPPDVILERIRANLGNAYCDLSSCLLHTCGIYVNRGAHAVISGIHYGCKDEISDNNLLYCMDMANGFMSARQVILQDSEQNREFALWHNQGYELLKKPDPEGTPGRDWVGAANSYRRAISLRPDSAPSYHGLGLAFEGQKNSA